MSDYIKRVPPDPRVVLCGQSPVSSLIFGQDETYKERPVIFSGHEKGHIMEWSVVTQRATASWHAHSHSVIWLAWTLPDKLLSQGRDGVIRLWGRDGVDTWISFGEIPCALFLFCDSAVMHHNNHFKLAVPMNEAGHIDVHVLEESTLAALLPRKSAAETCPMSTVSHSIKPPSATAYGMCMRIRMFIAKNSDPYLLVGFESGSLTLWNLLNGVLLNEVKAYSDSIMSMDCWVCQETNSVRCVTGSADNVLKMWLVEADKLVQNVSISVTNPGISAISIRQDGRIFASGGWDHRVRIASLRKFKPLAVLAYHTGSVHCTTFGPDNTLATGSQDGYIALWDVYQNV